METDQGDSMPRVKRQITRQREARAWELRQQGWSLRRIAAEIGLGHSGVFAILRRVEKRVLAKLNADVEAEKARQFAVLDHILDEALQAWERSREPDKSITRKVGTNALGAMDPVPGEPVLLTSRDSDGDPRYLSEARSALADLRKLWGLDAPNKHELAGKDGAPLHPIEFIEIALSEPQPAGDAALGAESNQPEAVAAALARSQAGSTDPLQTETTEGTDSE
jgi:hypothetical protein